MSIERYCECRNSIIVSVTTVLLRRSQKLWGEKFY